MLIDNIKLTPRGDSHKALLRACASKMGVGVSDIGALRIKRRSIDARKKQDIHIIYTVECALRGERLSDEPKAEYRPLPAPPSPRPIVVGSGPAGMLCALTLARSGAAPIVIERGRPVDERVARIEDYFSGGQLDPQTNVQFGEGGAGTFSDGKLTTGTKDERIAIVNSIFVEAGADKDIIYSAKPHIGTDVLRRVVANIRAMIEQSGGEYRFSTRLADINIKNGCLESVVLDTPDGIETVECNNIVLACGHSARDTFEMLHSRGVYMEQKAFSIGARIEHPQALIDTAQYGALAGLPALGAADYKLAMKTSDGRGVYTFCMCPGGYVVAAASEPESICTNGMSCRARDGANANSAVLVGITPDDFGSEHPLAGMYLQRSVERAAYCAESGSRAPAQLVGDFLAGRSSACAGSVIPSYRPGVRFGSIDCCLPPYITSAMREGIIAFDKKLHGFAAPDAVLTAPETRSSSPVRICRDRTLQSSVRGIYPCGEGAGYAGGIMSAAVDGIRCAEALLELYR